MHVRRSIPFLLIVTSLYCSLAEERQAKRVPSGFTGVRGKKSIAEGAYQEQDIAAPDTAMDKRVPSGFMGMRGKKPFDFQPPPQQQPWEGTYPEAMFKRAPSGFMGMRGKKDMELVGYDDYYKRAPSGFMGMRGKKEGDNFYSDKRTPMGFVGMRGKKDVEDTYAGEDKRAPQGFFGMRGKKLQRMSGFFGMRGKKYPYEFRGKFVGVRGKKSLYAPVALEAFRNIYAPDLDMNQLLLLLTERSDADLGAANLVEDDEDQEQE